MYSEPKNDLGKTVWLKFEVTNEVTDEKNRKKSSVFKGFRRQGVKSTASRLPVALRSSASAKLYQKWSKTPELRGFRGFSFSNGLTQFDRTKPLLTRFLWVKWWTTTPKRGLMG